MEKTIETIKANYDEYNANLKATWVYYDELEYLRSRRLQRLYKAYYNPPSWVLQQRRTLTPDYCYTVIYLLKIH